MVSAPTLTAYTDEAPCPRVEVFFDDLDPDTATITAYRTAKGREYKVRGMVGAAVAGAISRIDYETPFNTASSYRAEMFDAAGLSLGFTPSASVSVSSDSSWLLNPLDPQGAVKVSLAASTGRELSRPVPGAISRPAGRRVGVVVSEPRSGLQGFQLDVRVSTLDDADKVQALIGGYGVNAVPVVCLRLGGDEGRLRIPQPLFLGVLDIVEVDIDTVWGGTDTLQSMVGDEVSPPTPALFIPLLRRMDIDAYYASRDAIDAAYLSRSDIDRDYSLAGYGS